MKTLHRDCRHVMETDRTVNSSVSGKVIHAGRNQIRIAGVVAQNSDRNLTLQFRAGHRPRRGLGDVRDKLIVAAGVPAGSVEVNVHFALLADTFEMQEDASAGKWIGEFQPGAIPGGPW